MKTLLDQWKFALVMAADKRLSRGDLSVGFFLVDHINKEKGVAWPSYERLAECTNITRRSAFTSVQRLLGFKYFTKVSGGGRGHSNRYMAEIETVSPTSPFIDKECSPLLNNSVVDCQTTVSPTSPEPTYTCGASSDAGIVVGSPPLRGASAGATAPARGGAPEGFDDFWQMYPKKEGRKKAKEAFAEALRSGVSADLLRTKAAQYAEAKAGIDAKWLKTPGNWLQGECWLEDPQPSRLSLKKTRSASKRSKSKIKKVRLSAKRKQTDKQRPEAQPDPTQSKIVHHGGYGTGKVIINAKGERCVEFYNGKNIIIDPHGDPPLYENDLHPISQRTPTKEDRVAHKMGAIGTFKQFDECSNMAEIILDKSGETHWVDINDIGVLEIEI